MAEYTQIVVSRHGPMQERDEELWRAVVTEGGRSAVVDLHVTGSAAAAGVERVSAAAQRLIRGELAPFPPNPDRLDVLRHMAPFAISTADLVE
jgi:hypothetical protein